MPLQHVLSIELLMCVMIEMHVGVGDFMHDGDVGLHSSLASLLRHFFVSGKRGSE